MVVLIGANASDTRGAMNRELAAPTNANDLLQWLAIKFGARPVPYHEYRIERVPIARLGALSRGLIKRILRFKDA
jgi:hypothetical protein